MAGMGTPTSDTTYDDAVDAIECAYETAVYSYLMHTEFGDDPRDAVNAGAEAEKLAEARRLLAPYGSTEARDFRHRRAAARMGDV